MSHRSSALAPLRNAAFRALWIAVAVSNIGAWMQTVGAQWLLVGQPNAAILVSLVQVADTLPDVAFGLFGGVLADIFDRRRLLLALQAVLVTVGLALTILTFTGEMPPAVLLLFTFLLGTASVVALPAYQSLVGDLVPRSQMRAAAALGSISFNIARAVGPALAGLLIARLGVAAVFGVDTAAFVFFAAVLLAWRPQLPERKGRPERFVSAFRAGGRYVWNTPVVMRMFLRTSAFLVPASAVWALLPLVATERLHLMSDGYGLLMAALGAGAVGGALALPWLNARLSMNHLVAAAGVVSGTAMVVVVGLPSLWLAMAVLALAGVAWIAVLSNMTAALQLFLPAWVRGRGMSVFQMVSYGSQGAGALLWGLVASQAGLVWSFAIAGVLLVVGASASRLWPLVETSAIDTSPSRHWADPRLAPGLQPSEGTIVVSVIYTIAADRESPFLEAMSKVRSGRLRTGAIRWDLYRDAEEPRRFVELFAVGSWDEHLRQHEERLTVAEREREAAAAALSDPPPQTRHLLAADPDG